MLLAAFWKFPRDVRAQAVDLRLQVLEVASQEILTKDLVAYAKQAKPVDYLYKELQFGRGRRDIYN